MRRSIVKYLVPPWNHQLKAIEEGSLRDDYGLFFEMGAGKTMTAINILRHWCVQEGRILKTLVLCPPIVIRQWQEEFYRHSQLGKYTVPLEGSGKKRKATIEQYTGLPRIFITNYESIVMEEVREALLRYGIEALLGDESHKLKNGQAKRTQAAIQIADQTKKRLILTGSPILNKPMDLFAQFRVLDKGETFGKNFFVFRAQYFYDKNAGMPKHKYFPLWVPRPKTNEIFAEKVAKKSMRVKKSECMDLPPFVKQKVFVDLSPDQKRLYEEVKKDLISYIGEKAVVANIALTKLLRLQQIVSGYAVTEDLNGNESIKRLANPRAKCLSELLEDLTPENKVIVWATFKQNYYDIAQVCKDLGVCHVEIHGEKNAKQKQEAVEQFRSDPSTRIVLANPKAGGVGLNLVEASYSIYYSRGYSLEDHLQSEARNYRGGSEIHEKVTRIDLIAPGTIDETILEALSNKINISEKILDTNFISSLL